MRSVSNNHIIVLTETSRHRSDLPNGLALIPHQGRFTRHRAPSENKEVYPAKGTHYTLGLVGIKGVNNIGKLERTSATSKVAVTIMDSYSLVVATVYTALRKQHDK